jgi:hypothetical protein
MDSSPESVACSVGHSAEPSSVYDNFYSPENRAFYAQKPYKPLDRSLHQIRLLRLLPLETESDGELSFDLLDNISLAGSYVQYTALSYCAGDPKKTVPICVNGSRFNAFANLGHALKEVVIYWETHGRKVEEECLWADQICIDQSNPDERSHQVGIMSEIYRGAERVLVCLAERESNGVGMQWAIGVYQWLKRQRPGVDLPSWLFLSQQGRALLNQYFVENISLPTTQQDIVAFFQLVQSPWWTRAWICQEFVFAREANFLHSGNSIAWRDFAIVLLHSRDWFKKFFDPGLPHENLLLDSGNHDESPGSKLAYLDIEDVHLGRTRLDPACRLI